MVWRKSLEERMSSQEVKTKRINSSFGNLRVKECGKRRDSYQGNVGGGGLVLLSYFNKVEEF